MMCPFWSQEEGSTSQLKKNMSERIAPLAAMVGWSTDELLDHSPSTQRESETESF